MRGVRAAVELTAIASAVTTAALAVIPRPHLAYSWHAEDLALETAASVIALLASFLVFGRLRRHTRLNDSCWHVHWRSSLCPTCSW